MRVGPFTVRQTLMPLWNRNCPEAKLLLNVSRPVFYGLPQSRRFFDEFPIRHARKAVPCLQPGRPVELDRAAGHTGAWPAASDADPQRLISCLSAPVLCRPLRAALVQPVEREVVYRILPDHVPAARAAMDRAVLPHHGFEAGVHAGT